MHRLSLKIMQRPARLLLLAVLLVSGNALATDAKIRHAEQVAGKWLALIDGQRYQLSWEQSAILVRQQLDAAEWARAISAARQPLGNMLQRKLLSATYTTSLPGAPDGEYVVLQYQTRFENKKNSIETITPMLDGAEWRVSGYYVR